MNKPQYSIVIPTFNEQRRILATIKTIYAFFEKKKVSFEVIVSDDHSSDETVKVVKKATKDYLNLTVLESAENFYKGWPVKKGVVRSQGEYILITDADLSTPIVESDKLANALKGGFDLAIGSRIDERGHDMRESQPLYRRILGKTFTYIRKSLTPDIQDSQCGFKMFKKEAGHDLFSRQRIKNIIFDVEILYMAKRLNYKIAQIPVKWYYDGETRMRLTLKNAVSTLLSLVQIYLWHWNEKA